MSDLLFYGSKLDSLALSRTLSHLSRSEIYLTDGYAPAPEVRPPCPLLRGMTADGSGGDHLRFGRTVELPVRG